MGLPPRQIDHTKVYMSSSLNWTIGDDIFICFSGAVAVGFAAESSDDWRTENILISIPLANVLPQDATRFTGFNAEKVVSHFSLDAFRFEGDGDNGGFSVNDALHIPTNGNSALSFNVSIGTRCEDRAFIDRLRFSVTAKGQLVRSSP